ncbi:MAG: gamma carbonic anhydrase family protein [Acidobacteria bacterium]|nr:MAG: gamma carbonic anhydrase family protein [Acidobacteriota bacterium]
MTELPANRLSIDPLAFVAPGAMLIGEVSVGADSSVWFGTVLRGDLEPIRIGEQSNIQDLSVVHTDPGCPANIGDCVTVGHRAVIHGATLEAGCLIGMGAVVLSGARIGAGALVAAGAVVREGFQVPAGTLAAGVPAKLLRELTEEEKERVARNCVSYVESARLYRAGAYRATR